MKSVLRSPKYNVCSELMQRQLDESRHLPTMSMDLSISGSEDESDCYDIGGHFRGGDVAVGNVAGEDQALNTHDVDGANYLDRHDRNIAKSGCNKESHDCGGIRDSGDVGVAPTQVPTHEDHGKLLVAAQEPKLGWTEAEGANEPEIQREWNAESAGAQGEERAPAEAVTSTYVANERGAVRESGGGNERTHRSSGPCRSKGKRRGSNCDTSRRDRSKERGHGLRTAAPPASKASPLPPGRTASQPLGFGKRSSKPGKDEESTQEDQQHPNADPSPVISASHCDAKGRCIHHPQVRLRKKRILGGWKALLSVCPNCCVEQLYRLQLAEHGKKESARLQQESQGCRPLLYGEVSTSGASLHDSFRTASITASSHGSDHQQWATTHERKKSKSKGKDPRNKPLQQLPTSSKSKGKGPENKPQSQGQARAQNKASMRAVKMNYTDENNLPGIYDGQINDRLLPHGWGTMIYAHDGSIREGQWEDGRYWPENAATGGSSRSRPRTQTRKGGQSRGASRDKAHRKRPSCTGECYH